MMVGGAARVSAAGTTWYVSTTGNDNNTHLALALNMADQAFNASTGA
jgi:hypothetical protein